MNKKIPVIAIVLVVLLAIGAGILMWKNNKMKEIAGKEKQVQQNKEAIIDKNLKLALEPKDIIQQFKSIFFDSPENTGTQVRENPCFSWIEENNIDFGPIGGWMISSGRPNKDSVQKDIALMTELFLQNGFVKNDRNYKNSEDIDRMPGEKIGFEKENLKCAISWSENAIPDNDPRKEIFAVSCIKTSHESEKDFNDIYPAFKEYDPPAGYSKLDNITRFCISKKGDDFAMGMVGQTSAPSWYAKKENGKWIITMITQDYPLCDRVKNFPTEYYEKKCFYNDKNGKLQLKQDN